MGQHFGVGCNEFINCLVQAGLSWWPMGLIVIKLYLIWGRPPHIIGQNPDYKGGDMMQRLNSSLVAFGLKAVKHG